MLSGLSIVFGLVGDNWARPINVFFGHYILFQLAGDNWARPINVFFGNSIVGKI